MSVRLRYNQLIVTHVYGSRGVRVFKLRLSVSLIPHDISKIDAARIAELDTEMFHDESR